MPLKAGKRGSARPRSSTPEKISPVRQMGWTRNTEVARDRSGQILHAAAKLFAEYGFEATSMRQIAEEVGIIAPSIYYHFATKEDILHRIIRQTVLDSVEIGEYIRDMPVDAELRLVANTIKRFDQYVRQFEVHTILLQESQFLRRTADFSYVSDMKLRTFNAQHAILVDGMETGLFHPGIDTYLTIGTISRMLSSAAAWFRRGDIFSSDKPSEYTIDRVVDYHLDCILRMVRTPSRLENPIPREFCERLVGVHFGAE